jgi:hypothetical protein
MCFYYYLAIVRICAVTGNEKMEVKKENNFYGNKQLQKPVIVIDV